ncbi:MULTISPECIES: PilX N-terminal domain-containing pilus assembly protein [unclassified Thioalkalivibrio]|uniref:pilus assembly PilX family protein n=1 Tax=unclassified Thioalkalivibrio TaxID=2621013 RepID=UPI00035F6506|nr:MULTISPECIES: PilX N-terminal domain-containing pilus assembly protein [unclassified Thioalkalivibrio]
MRTQPTQAACANRGKQHQQGAALVVGLILLVVITLLAVAGMQNTVLQERMAGNMHDRNLAFQAAEAALRQGERQAMNDGTSHADLPSDFRSGDPEAWFKRLVDDGEGSSATSEISGLYAQPRFYIERLDVEFEDEGSDPDDIVDDEYGQVDERVVYRVTSVARGGSQNTIVILQSTRR